MTRWTNPFWKVNRDLPKSGTTKFHSNLQGLSESSLSFRLHNIFWAWDPDKAQLNGNHVNSCACIYCWFLLLGVSVPQLSHDDRAAGSLSTLIWFLRSNTLQVLDHNSLACMPTAPKIPKVVSHSNTSQTQGLLSFWVHTIRYIQSGLVTGCW